MSGRMRLTDHRGQLDAYGRTLELEGIGTIPSEKDRGAPSGLTVSSMPLHCNVAMGICRPVAWLPSRLDFKKIKCCCKY